MAGLALVALVAGRMEVRHPSEKGSVMDGTSQAVVARSTAPAVASESLVQALDGSDGGGAARTPSSVTPTTEATETVVVSALRDEVPTLTCAVGSCGVVAHDQPQERGQDSHTTIKTDVELAIEAVFPQVYWQCAKYIAYRESRDQTTAAVLDVNGHWSIGAWQVQPVWWGAVPDDALGQAQQVWGIVQRYGWAPWGGC